MKKIEIKVTATKCTDEEMRVSKKFAVLKTARGSQLINRTKFLSKAEYAILKSIFMRIVEDKDNLINWCETPSAGTVSAKIEIIPAKDYIPE